jgi:hypothetical protein
VANRPAYGARLRTAPSSRLSGLMATAVFEACFVEKTVTVIIGYVKLILY